VSAQDRFRPLASGTEKAKCWPIWSGIENNWFAVTGRVVAVKVEADGDPHIALQDATGDKPGIVVVEVAVETAVV
jgi:hypothetical protein